MKSKEFKSNKPVQEYPCLKVAETGPDTRFVVLFTSEYTGTVVFTTDRSHHELGHHSHSWDPNAFKPYNGEITLTP